jgi:hypothetical protein
MIVYEVRLCAVEIERYQVPPTAEDRERVADATTWAPPMVPFIKRPAVSAKAAYAAAEEKDRGAGRR